MCAAQSLILSVLETIVFLMNTFISEMNVFISEIYVLLVIRLLTFSNIFLYRVLKLMGIAWAKNPFIGRIIKFKAIQYIARYLGFNYMRSKRCGIVVRYCELFQFS